MLQKLSIVIPAYNEGRTIHFILDKVKAVQMINMIEKEIDILLKLDHPNIIKLLDFKRTVNNYYLIFEFCEYGDLDHYIK